MKQSITRHHDFEKVEHHIVAIEKTIGCSIQVYYEVELQVIIDKITNAVLTEFGISIKQLKSCSRKENLKDARLVFVYIIQDELKLTCLEVAKLLNRDRTTINNMRLVVHDFISINDAIIKRIFNVKKRLNERTKF